MGFSYRYHSLHTYYTAICYTNIIQNKYNYDNDESGKIVILQYYIFLPATKKKYNNIKIIKCK